MSSKPEYGAPDDARLAELAATQHGVVAIRGLVHVTAPTRHNVPGVRCHSARSIHPRDVTKVDDIPVTTLERTLLDLAEAKDRRNFGAALKQAQHEDRLDLRRPTAPGTPS